MTNNEVSRIYDILLSIPGMNETVKIDLKASRKTVLMLCQVIEKGLSVKDEKGLPEATLAETANELKGLVNDWLEKAGLAEFNKKLQGIQPK